jgi:DNA-binding IclR family transcriptional regulator
MELSSTNWNYNGNSPGMSLANAAAVLHWLKRDRHDVAVGELAGTMGWPKSSSSRLLKEMHDLGLLERDPETRRYRVGMLMLELGRHYRAGEPLVEAADAELAELTRQTGHSTGISLLDGINVVVLRSRPGTHPLRVVTPPGTRGPAWGNSSGRVLLARLADAEIADRFTPYPESPLGNAPADLARLMQRIARARAQGWDDSQDEAWAGIGGVSVAVDDPHAGAPFAMYFAFSSMQVSRPERRELGGVMLDVAARLRARFGDAAPGSANGPSRRSTPERSTLASGLPRRADG